LNKGRAATSDVEMYVLMTTFDQHQQSMAISDHGKKC
jgi:hypothetical protein